MQIRIGFFCAWPGSRAKTGEARKKINESKRTTRREEDPKRSEETLNGDTVLCGNRRERESETVSVESETREEKREMDENEKDRLPKENPYIGRLRLPVHVTTGQGFWVWADSIQLVLFPSVYTWHWRHRLMPIFNDVPSLLLHN